MWADPLFPLMFLCDSIVPWVLDSVMQVTMFCALLLGWVCVLHGLRQVSVRLGRHHVLRDNPGRAVMIKSVTTLQSGTFLPLTPVALSASGVGIASRCALTSSTDVCRRVGVG